MQPMIVVGLGLILVFVYFVSITKADIIYGIDGISDKELVKAEKLSKQLIKINELLEKRIPNDFEPQRSIQVAEDKLDELGQPSICLPSCLLPSKQSYREALELFVSLRNILGYCDTGRYEKLSNMLLATQESHRVVIGLARIEHVVEYYFKRHARLCRPKYKAKVLGKLQYVNREVLSKVDRAFSQLTVAHFLPELDRPRFRPFVRYDLVGMRNITFLTRASRPAHQEISRQIMNQLKGGPNESLTKISGVNLETLRSVLDDYLYEPCTIYRHELGSILTEARLYAAIYDGQAQVDYIHGNEQFYHALINNRLCKSLLDERSKLYDLFIEAWNNVLASNIDRQQNSSPLR